MIVENYDGGDFYIALISTNKGKGKVSVKYILFYRDGGGLTDSFSSVQKFYSIDEAKLRIAQYKETSEFKPYFRSWVDRVYMMGNEVIQPGRRVFSEDPENHPTDTIEQHRKELRQYAHREFIRY